MRVAWLFSATLLVLVAARDALACSCPSSGPPCQNAFQVDAVFAGTVRSISPLPEDGPPLRPSEMRIPRTLQVEFDAVLPFRGIQASTVSVLTAGSGPACGYSFKQGVRYLVYASRNTQGPGLVTGICSRTRPLAEAADDLRFFQTLSAPDDRARLYGTVTHWERDVATEQPRDYGAMPDLRVNVGGAGTVLDTWTDDAGRFDLKLPPGKYEITFLPPPGFSTKSLQHSIDLPVPRSCAVLDWSVSFDGRIRGLVQRRQEESSAEIPVELMAVEALSKSGNVSVLRAAIDSAGRYEFTEVPPGRYLVGVDLVRRMDAKVVFPTTFHPGTQDASLATVVELQGGQQRDLEPMTLPPARHAYQLVGTVVFEDGSPASGASISLSDGIAKFRQVAGGIKIGPDGTFSFLVHEGLSYIALASFWDESQRKQVTGSFGPFVIGGDLVPFKVVLSSPK